MVRRRKRKPFILEDLARLCWWQLWEMGSGLCGALTTQLLLNWRKRRRGWQREEGRPMGQGAACFLQIWGWLKQASGFQGPQIMSSGQSQSDPRG